MSTDRIIASLPRSGPGQSARFPLTSSNVLPIGSRGDGELVLTELLEEKARAKEARAEELEPKLEPRARAKSQSQS